MCKMSQDDNPALCFQWDEYERARLPLTKRVYWVKRVDGLGFISPETQAEAAVNVQLRMRTAQAQAVMAAPVAAKAASSSSVSPAAAAFHLPSGTTMAQIVPIGGAKVGFSRNGISHFQGLQPLLFKLN